MLTISDVVKNKIRFKDVSGNFSATQHPHSVYWLRFKVRGNVGDNRKWIVEILDSRQDEVVLYQPEHNGNYINFESGVVHGFAKREYSHKNFVFNLSTNVKSDHYF